MNRKDLWVQWLLERIKYDLDEQPGEQEWNRLKSNLDFAFTQFLKDLDDARRKARLEQEKKYQWVRFYITIMYRSLWAYAKESQKRWWIGPCAVLKCF